MKWFHTKNIFLLLVVSSTSNVSLYIKEFDETIVAWMLAEEALAGVWSEKEWIIYHQDMELIEQMLIILKTRNTMIEFM